MTDTTLLDSERFGRCLEIQRKVSSERDLTQLAQCVMREVTALLGADRSTLFLFNWDTMDLRANFAEGVQGRELVVPLRMGVVGTAILRRELMNLTNAHTSPYFNPEIDAMLGYHTDSLLVAPMLGEGGRILGGVELLNKTTGRFTTDDEALLTKMSARLARWVERGDVYPAGVEAEVISLRNAVGCDRGSVFVLEERTSRLLAIYADGGDGRSISLNMKLGIAGQVAVTGRSIRIDEVWDDPRFDRSVDQRTGYRTRSMLCVPLKAASGESLGVLQAINKREGVFADVDLEVLEAVAGIVAIAVENAVLLADQERQFLSTVNALTMSVEMDDGGAVGRTTRVADRAVAIARDLGFGADELDQIRLAAMLHDFGMASVDDEIINKPGPLDAEEFDRVKLHTKRTEDILSTVHFTRKYRKVIRIAAAHHEALDGSGYPHGLTATEIPFLAKILTVADVFDAMTSDRPYRPKLSRDEALAVLQKGVGTRFDVTVVDSLKKLLAESTSHPVAVEGDALKRGGFSSEMGGM